ncbi:MAG: 6-phosphogluconolactonase [Actinomycetes bacterium]
MSPSPTSVVVHATPDLLAAAAAARLVTRLVDAQASRGHASLVLTGGTIGISMLRHLASCPPRDAVDWRRVDLWWGDERFLPAGDPDRNETQAREALLDVLPLDPARVHPMPASDGPDGDDVDAAAARYAGELRAASRPEDHGDVPTFDVLLLGVGPDGHCASLFPEQPAVYETERSVVGVRSSPKPPPTRISLTMPALCAAEDVWFVVAGRDKAPAVEMALSGAGPVQVPAAGPSGRRRTLWLLDREAASSLPPGLARLASP